MRNSLPTEFSRSAHKLPTEFVLVEVDLLDPHGLVELVTDRR